MATAVASLAGSAAALLVTRLLAAQGARPARPAHRPAEPRPARRPYRPGARALAAHGRAVRAARRRPRRVQGRQRRPRARGRRTPFCARSPAGSRPSCGRPTRSPASGATSSSSSRSGRASDEEAAALVGRIRQALRRPYRVDGSLVEIDASIGWALFPQDGLTPAELLARADGQMYATKRDTSDEPSAAPPAARRRDRARARAGARARGDHRPLPADRGAPRGRRPDGRGARSPRPRREPDRAGRVRPARRAHPARPDADARRRARRARTGSSSGTRQDTSWAPP